MLGGNGNYREERRNSRNGVREGKSVMALHADMIQRHRGGGEEVEKNEKEGMGVVAKANASIPTSKRVERELNVEPAPRPKEKQAKHASWGNTHTNLRQHTHQQQGHKYRLSSSLGITTVSGSAQGDAGSRP